MNGDRGDIVLGWLVRICLVLTVFAVIAFDAVSVGLAHVGAQDDGTQAAFAASEMFHSTHNVQRAFNAASEYAEERGATVDPKTFRVDPDGRVRLSVTKTATTLLLYRVSPLEKWATVSAEADAKAVPNS